MLTPALREAALFPHGDLPDPPEGYPFKTRKGDGYQVGFHPGTSYAMVFVRRLAEERLAEIVAEVRALLAGEGFTRAGWILSEATEPIGIVERLKDHGLVVWEREAEGLGPRFRSMALTSAPTPAPEGVVARQVETFAEYAAGARVASDAFDTSEEDRKVFEQQQADHWEWLQRYPSFKSFVAVLDGEVVGSASAMFGANAVFMVGGSVRADSRGRGAYRALVRARWDAAVERGTPALTVSAGSMSGPVLERLGFTTVGWGDILADHFA